MSRQCCHECRVRFTAVASTYLTSCPECGRLLTSEDGAESLLGFRLFDPLNISDAVPEALAVSLPAESDWER
jgi:hypothetical protein